MDLSTMMNVVTTQCRRCCTNIPMNTFAMMNALSTRRRISTANISMEISATMNALTTQLGTSCTFDSPGLARNEPTPGRR